MSSLLRGLALFAITLQCSLLLSEAAFAPGPGARGTELFDTRGSFTILEGLCVDDTRAYVGNGTLLKSVGMVDGSVRTEGTLPGSLTVAFVQRLDDTTYTAFGTSFSSPFPYSVGLLETSGVYSNLLAEDGVFDAAVNGLGELYFVANPGAAGSKLFRLNLPAGTATEIADFGGFSGGLAFDEDNNLYYAYQAPFPGTSAVVRLTAAQVAAGGLTLADATNVVPVGASFLAIDNHGDLLATTGFGNSLNKYDVSDGRLIRTLATDDASGFGVGKFVWDTARNRIVQIYTDFSNFDSTLYELLQPFVPSDFDRNGATDLAVYDTTSGTWSIHQDEKAGSTLTQNWGWSDALPVSGDFDGDARADFAVFWPEQAYWYILYSAGGGIIQQWGWNGVTAVPADYDGDGITDIAVYDPRTGDWYVRQSSDGTLLTQNWGWSEADPVPADYDGDGKADLAVYHPATGDWYVRRSSDAALVLQNWGWSEADPVPADYDGDGRADLAVYHQATGDWYVRQSSDTALVLQNWGWSEADPVPSDYDADGRSDFAVYHQAAGDWYIRRSRNGTLFQKNWGGSNSVPVL